MAYPVGLQPRKAQPSATYAGALQPLHTATGVAKDFATNLTVTSTPEFIHCTMQTIQWVDRYVQIVFGASVTLTALNPLTFTPKPLLSNNNVYWLQIHNHRRVVTTTPTEDLRSALCSDSCAANLHSQNLPAQSTSKQHSN